MQLGNLVRRKLSAKEISLLIKFASGAGRIMPYWIAAIAKVFSLQALHKSRPVSQGTKGLLERNPKTAPNLLEAKTQVRLENETLRLLERDLVLRFTV